MSIKSIDYNAEVELLFNSRRVNTFMANYLLGMASSGLNEELWQEGIDDAIVATELGVDNENDFYIFFYIDHFVEDLVEEIFHVKLNNNEEESLKKYLFSLRSDVDLFDLLSYRVSILQWLKQNKEKAKVAHPNSTIGVTPLKKYDLRHWNSLAVKVRRDAAYGIPRDVALQNAASVLPAPEKFDFLTWYNLKFIHEENKKYNVNDTIRNLNRRASVMNDISKFGTILNDKNYYYVPKLPTSTERIQAPSIYSEQNVQDFESLRAKIMSRVFSIDKLLERYRKVLDPSQIDAIEDCLTELRKRIRKLKLASSIHDSIIKTANLVMSHNADDIAHALIAIAEDPNPADDAADLEKKDGPKQPAVPSTPNDLTPEQRTIIINDIVAQLEAISTVIKSREIVRALSRVDILLNKLYMDTFFPELSDAQAKLIEAYGYASNKVEDILPKIKGGTSDDRGYKIPELSDQSKELAKEVSQLSENLVAPSEPVKEVEEEIENVVPEKKGPIVPQKPAVPAKPVEPAPAKEVEEEEPKGNLLRPIPEI